MSIVEVARLAGVSNATVSRVINKHPTVQADIVKSVEAAIAQLQYAPSPRRRHGKSKVREVTEQGTPDITMVVLGLSDGHSTPAYADMMQGLLNASKHHRVKLVLQNVSDPERLSEQLASQAVDGLLLHGRPSSAEVVTTLRNYPTVWLMADNWQPEWGDQVMPDMYEVGHRAAHYLLARGHKQLGFINLDQRSWATHLARGSFAAAATRAGAAMHFLESDSSRQPQGFHDSAAVDVLVKQFLKLKPRPTGLFVADDIQLAAIQPALQGAGVEFGPGKLEIVSCNNDESFLAGLSPMPAEIGLCAEVIGFQAVEQLLWRIKNKDVPERVVTCVEPIVLQPDGHAAS